MFVPPYAQTKQADPAATQPAP